MKLPRNWQHTTGYFHIQHDGFAARHIKKPNTADHELRLSKLHLGPGNHTVYITVKNDHPLYKQADDVARNEVALIKEREELEAKLKRLLAGINTDKQLIEVWPEGEPFFPEFETPARGMIPVSLVNEINKAIAA
jgi:hypothetical protein